MAICKNCGVWATWAKWKSSERFVLLDPRPVPQGNLLMSAGSRYPDSIPRVRVARVDEMKDAPVQLGLDPSGAEDTPLLWRVHKATCVSSRERR